MDSNRLRAVVGKRRPLTLRETELRTMEAKHLFGAVESPVLRTNGEGLDYIDLIALPSLWASPVQLAAIARHAALSPSDRRALLDSPDDFLQSRWAADAYTWMENPIVSLALDRAWEDYVMRRIASGVRSAAIQEVFRGSLIAARIERAA